MPKYIAIVTKTDTYSAEIEIEAEDQDKAMRKAEERLEDGGGTIGWQHEDEVFDIEEISEEDA